MKDDEEIIRLLHGITAMLEEVLGILRKFDNPTYRNEENTNDFVMNIIANLIASKIEKGRK